MTAAKVLINLGAQAILAPVGRPAVATGVLGLATEVVWHAMCGSVREGWQAFRLPSLLLDGLPGIDKMAVATLPLTARAEAGHGRKRACSPGFNQRSQRIANGKAHQGAFAPVGDIVEATIRGHERLPPSNS